MTTLGECDPAVAALCSNESRSGEGQFSRVRFVLVLISAVERDRMAAVFGYFAAVMRDSSRFTLSHSGHLTR